MIFGLRRRKRRPSDATTPGRFADSDRASLRCGISWVGGNGAPTQGVLVVGGITTVDPTDSGRQATIPSRFAGSGVADSLLSTGIDEGCGFRTSIPGLPYTPAVIGRWVTHALIYLSACSTISIVWVLLTDGTVEDLKGYGRTPGDALTLSFWPVWFWLLWGTFVAMHLAVVVGRLIPRRGGRAGRGTVHRSGRRHVVAMFTDLSGSTKANERLGDEAWAALVRTHRRTVRELTSAHGGKEVGTQGDGFFVRFYEPGNALDCAMALQRRCREERAEGSPLPPVRIGIHQGKAVHGDDDVLGQVVNIAARLLEVAEPHEILLTEPVADGVDPETLVDRGLVGLKGIAQPRHLLSLRWDPDAPEATAAPRRARTLGRRRRRSVDWRLGR